MSFKNCSNLMCIFILYTVGAMFFFSGFLLKRHSVLEHTSSSLSVAFNITCRNFSSLQMLNFSQMNHLKSGVRKTETSMPYTNKLERYKKAVVIIIDALRYDFVVFNNLSTRTDEQYLNNMPIFKELLNDYPRQSSLIKLTADAPTTTLQRLKAITTGSLPTFIDLSMNFASTEITEDNLVYQIRHNKEIVFMGDDTWEGLYPGHFKRSFPYPSFNVKDLDTVDYGILDHIFVELQKNDWDVLIAHFLGVDHCGHRYGPRHPEMKRKLNEMDGMLRKVVPLLKEDTILFVLGDHGMTESGDHGGDSDDEVATTLFVYSPSYIFAQKPDEDSKKAAQIDFVPTLALLLGLPIPFSNLGSVMPEFFSLQSHNYSESCFHTELDHLLGGTLALAENAMQVHQFLSVYTNMSSDLPDNIMKNSEIMLNGLSRMWLNITEDVNQSKRILESLFMGYKEYLSYVRNECAKTWATFDLNKMSLGMLIVFVAVCFNIICASGFSLDLKSFCLLLLYVAASLAVGLTHGFMKFVAFIFIFLISVLCRQIVMKVLLGLYLSINRSVCFAFSVLTLICVCNFSNSFVVYEDHIVLLILQSALVFKYFPVIQNCFISCLAFRNKTKKKKHLNQKDICRKLLLFLMLLCIMAGIRFSTLFRKCREEQNCESSSFLVSLENLSDELSTSHKKLRLVISLVSVISPVVILIRNKLPLHSFSSAVNLFNHLRISYVLPFICACICMHWCISLAPPHLVQKILKKNQTVLSQSALIMSGIVFLTLWLIPILPDEPRSVPSKQIYSMSLNLLFSTIVLPSYLIAGDGLALAITIMVTIIALIPVLNHLSATTAADNSEAEFWLDAMIWGALSWNWFYGTGHQATFPSIQWQAAFVWSSKEVVSYVLSGFLVVFNTFSSQVLHSIALPFIFICTQPIRGDLDASLTRLMLRYLCFHGTKFLGASAACWILRRHLMVWKIFSPKLVFEAVSLVVTMISITVSYTFTLRTVQCYRYFLKSNMRSALSLNQS